MVRLVVVVIVVLQQWLLTFLLELCGGELAVSYLCLENLAPQNSLHLSNVIFNRR